METKMRDRRSPAGWGSKDMDGIEKTEVQDGLAIQIEGMPPTTPANFPELSNYAPDKGKE